MVIESKSFETVTSTRTLQSDGSLWGTNHQSQPEAGKNKRWTTCWTTQNILSEKTNENLVRGLNTHPISKMCSLFAAMKNVVGLTLSLRSGYAGILCLDDDLSTTALGNENNRDMIFNISITYDEKGCQESWVSVLGKLRDRKAGTYRQRDKYIKMMWFPTKKIFAVSCIKCCITLIETKTFYIETNLFNSETYSFLSFDCH